MPRGLARRTQDSTRQIEELVVRLQEVADKTVLRMEGNRALARAAAMSAAQAGLALGRITQSVSNID